MDHRLQTIDPHLTTMDGNDNDALMHDLLAAVEQQLASSQTKYVAKTLQRLVRTGLTEERAKEQIALCLGETMDAMMRTRRGFDEKSYREALDELPMEEGGEVISDP